MDKIDEIMKFCALDGYGTAYGKYIVSEAWKSRQAKMKPEKKKKDPKPKYRLTDVCSGEKIICYNMDEVADITNVTQGTVSWHLKHNKCVVGNFKVERIKEA